MTSRYVAAAFLPLLLFPAPGRGQDAMTGITAWTRTDGRVVFTNNVSHPSSLAVARPTDRLHPGERLHPLIDRAAAEHGVDARLVRAVIEVESAFDERAVSSAGAMGLMQLMPATGARFGVRNFFDPVENIDGGVRYLKVLLDMFQGDLDLSLAAYNSGENRVARLGRIPSIPETENYVRKVRAAYTRMGGWGLDPRRIPTAAPAEGPGPGTPGTTFLHTVDARGVRRFSSQ